MSHPLSVVKYPDTPNEFLPELQRSQLLGSEQLQQAESDFRDQPGEAQALADLMIRRGWLTSHQVEQLFLGRGALLRWGQYRVLDCVADGGMSEVYKAEHVLMQRIVALKVLTKSTLSPDAGQEIRLSARLRHPNVVTAFDAGVEHGRTYLVMEFVDGLNLHRLVQKAGPLPVGLTCDFVRQAALALQYAHEQGLLHRDVKPANLMITLQPTFLSSEAPTISELVNEMRWPLSEGICPVVKLLDLGIARFTTQKSNAEVLMGTPDYLPPEIAENRDAADERSDLYSLGCTFFHLLTGRVPYPADNWPETVVRHRFDPIPSVEGHRKDVPAAVQRMLHQLLAKSPADRYPDAVSLIRDLDQWLASNGSIDCASTSARLTPVDVASDVPHRDAPAPRKPTRRRRAWIGGTAMIVALMLGALLVSRELWIRLRAAQRKPTQKPDRPVFTPVVGSPELPKLAFLNENQSRTATTFAEAVENARDGDVITVLQAQPVRLEPVTIRDKRLTIRAALGGEVRLIFHPRDLSNPWQPMIGTNRSLTLEGIVLSYATGPLFESGSAPLLECSGTSLRLQRCCIEAEGHAAPISCRNTQTVEFLDCDVRAQTSALSVELRGKPKCKVVWRDCRAELASKTGAMISLWSSRPTNWTKSIDVCMEGNVLTTGRVLAFAAPSSDTAIRVTATDNDLRYHQGLVSFSGVRKSFPWRQIIQWKGAGNRHPTNGTGVMIDGHAVSDSLSRFAQ